jgi:hypothetical protein
LQVKRAIKVLYKKGHHHSIKSKIIARCAIALVLSLQGLERIWSKVAD